MTDTLLFTAFALCISLISAAMIYISRALHSNRDKQIETLQQFAAHQQNQFGKLQDFILRQQEHGQLLQSQQQGALRNELNAQLARQNEHLHREIHHLSAITEKRLLDISAHVGERLEQGFHQQDHTVKDIIERLAKIDEAQKRLDQLAGDVGSLKDVLQDKKSRGAFGESQLHLLIDNLIPAQYVSYQHTLPNGKRPDCLLHLPPPTGDLVIDAKFPLESYRKIAQAPQYAVQLAKDVKKHIDDIADKYICPPHTADGAILFIPAEAIFAELHANYPDIIDYAQHRNVWLTSPTTLAAVLTTAKAVLKDDATRRQAHLLREQLYLLRQDFVQFQERMNALARHIGQAQQDVNDIHRSAQSISEKFHQLDEYRGESPH